MALAELVQALEHDAAGQIRALLAAAQAQADQLEADASRGRDDAVARASDAYRAQCRADADARIADAQRASRTAVLAARAAMLDRVRAALRAELPARLDLAGDALVREAIACAGARPGVLRCPPVLVARARELAPSTLRVETAEVGSGVVIELASGTQIVATLDALLGRECPRLAAAIVAAVLAEDVA